MRLSRVFVIAWIARCLFLCAFLVALFVVTSRKKVEPFDDQTISAAVRYDHLRNIYLNTVRDTLCGLAFRTTELVHPFESEMPHAQFLRTPIGSLRSVQLSLRRSGEDWPVFALTMVGQARLQNIRELLEASRGVAGDFMECGVWRGGASIMAALVLDSMDDMRHVWLADSFSGLPQPRTNNDDAVWSRMDFLRVSLDEVKENMRAYDALSERVHFCVGYFVDSLPRCHPSNISVLRMDGDMYESTMDQLFNLYPLVSLGGYIIVDDWTLQPCQRALNDFWRWHGLYNVDVVRIDGSSMYWQKTSNPPLLYERYEKLKS